MRGLSLSRRRLLAGLGLSPALLANTPIASGSTPARLVVIGGGFGGVSAARTLRALLPNATIQLVEPNETYTACPFSNLVLGADRPLMAQQFSYQALISDGIDVIHETASDVHGSAKTVTLQSGQTLTYDRLILSPGIDLRWDAVEGYDEAAATNMPHAWKAGPQTENLRDQLSAMEDGGLVVMSVPPAPYRCPPGPYERASLIAHYLKTHKPRSKLLILDAKDSFSKMPLFLEAWAKHYPDHLEWRSASEDGRVSSVDANTKSISTDFETLRADVANIIPPQKAGWIADRAGVSDATGWCPIDAVSFESKLQPGIHVIGDATIAAPMPKSAFAANLQGKLCAIAVSDLLMGQAPQATTLANTCYSYTSPDEAVSIVGVYSSEGGVFSSVPEAGGLSPLNANIAMRQAEAAQAETWFAAITRETFR